MTIALQKVSATTAEEVCARFELGEDAAALLLPGVPPGAFLDQLISASLLNDAVQFLAYALPAHEGVWWSCVCVRSELGPGTPPPAVAALLAAEAWALKPDEDSRRAAGAAGDATEMDNGASWAAMGAFWSGGSMVRPDLPPVEPTPDLTPKAVFAAVTFAGHEKDPSSADARFQEYLTRGIDLANGGTGHAPE